MSDGSISKDVPRETLERLRRFEGLLLKWNRRINLVSPRDEAHLWQRHIEDSLQLLPLLPRAATRAIDLGSGGGFPGLVLAIASDLDFDLIEADQRKAAFLREAARVTDAPVHIHASRIEATSLPAAHLVTARALAPLGSLLTFAAPFLTQDGQCLLLKGANVEAELTDAASEWHMQVDRIPSRTAPQACILRISHLSRVHQTT
ncbi:MAG: 16S rRNA (guanine(527)-N(7))-methyltransferase RsmG [Acetobacteraceae bacterium]